MFEVDITNSFIFKKLIDKYLTIFVLKRSMSLILSIGIKISFGTIPTGNSIFFLFLSDAFTEYFPSHEGSKNFLYFCSCLIFPYILFLDIHTKNQIWIHCVIGDWLDMLDILYVQHQLLVRSLGVIVGEDDEALRIAIFIHDFLELVLTDVLFTFAFGLDFFLLLGHNLALPLLLGLLRQSQICDRCICWLLFLFTQRKLWWTECL